MLNAQQARLKSTESVIANLPGSLPDLSAAKYTRRPALISRSIILRRLISTVSKPLSAEFSDNLSQTDLRFGAAKLDYIDYRNKILVVWKKYNLLFLSHKRRGD